jgi:hypothetical protein
MTKDEIINELFALVEVLLDSGALLSEEGEKYDSLVGEYERICAKEEG